MRARLSRQGGERRRRNKMSGKIFRRTAIASVAAIAILVLMVPIVKLATNNSEVLSACVNPGNGNLRLVDSSSACHDNESFVQWDIEGPQGPPGSSSGGPPFVWACTPAHLPNASGSPRDDVYVFNGSGSTANIAVNILDSSGNNLTGVTIPGSSPASTYPGEAGASTVTLAPGHTRDLNWVMPTTGGPGFDGVTNVAVTVRVTSDQPIVVGANF